MSGVEANPPTSQESKTAKKKKAKAGAAAKETAVQPTVEADVSKSSVDLSTNGADASYESPYMKELYKCVVLDACCCRALPIANGRKHQEYP